MNNLLAEFNQRQNDVNFSIPFLNEDDGLININFFDYSKLNFHEILDLRTQDKHIYVLNKIKKDPSLIQYSFKKLERLQKHYKENDSLTLPYFSEDVEWSWRHILHNNQYEELIYSFSDYAIQMRQCSAFIPPELFSNKENLWFLEKWKNILISQSDRTKKNEYL